jgi:plasmid stabilization system protein ParE
VTLAAQSDIEEIVTTIWLDNPTAAEMIEDHLYEAFELLGENSGLGHQRPDLTDRPVLFWPVKKTPYAAIYRPASPVEILRIIHWRRNIADLMAGSADEPR